jgi:RNA polymerase sigma-B factor
MPKTLERVTVAERPPRARPLDTTGAELTVGQRYDRLLWILHRRPHDRRAREELAILCQPWIEQLARRFRGRGEPMDDLVQVARVGLMKAIDRFDVEREIRFVTYLTPIVLGELKRHFRDNGWAMHVPRRLQELSLEVRAAIDDAYQELQRSPTIDEIAARVGRPADDVLEALESASAYSVESLDSPFDADGAERYATLGRDDARLEAMEGWIALTPHLRALPDRDRLLLHLRFVKGRVQSQIADELGISQMHVSRLLADVIGRLRAAVTGAPPSAGETIASDAW